MIVTILNEAGHDSALLGMSLSFYDHKTPISEFWDNEKKQKAMRRAKKLAHMQGGHNKFLESITVYIYISAPRSFWSEFDTYRVGMTKQSASTMHTLDKRPVTIDDFEEGTSQHVVDGFNSVLKEYKDENSKYYKNITYLKNNLPEGWLQERVVVTNYKVLQNIISQRIGHRLKYWGIFIDAIINNVRYQEFLIQKE